MGKRLIGERSSALMYRVRLSKTAHKCYSRVDQNMAKRLDRCFKALEENPFDFAHHDIKRLHGKYEGLLRYRIGNFRVIYRVDRDLQIVEVITIRSRGQAY